MMGFVGGEQSIERNLTDDGRTTTIGLEILMHCVSISLSFPFLSFGTTSEHSSISSPPRLFSSSSLPAAVPAGVRSAWVGPKHISCTWKE